MLHSCGREGTECFQDDVKISGERVESDSGLLENIILRRNMNRVPVLNSSCYFETQYSCAVIISCEHTKLLKIFVINLFYQRLAMALDIFSRSCLCSS